MTSISEQKKQQVKSENENQRIKEFQAQIAQLKEDLEKEKTKVFSLEKDNESLKKKITVYQKDF